MLLEGAYEAFNRRDIPVALAAIILATAKIFVDYHIEHPVYALLFIVLVSASFSLLGFILGVWAEGFEKLQLVPMLILTPLTFLGGTFYSVQMLPEPWRTVVMFNPIFFLVSGLRWTFYGKADVGIGVSLGLTVGFLAICIAVMGR